MCGKWKPAVEGESQRRCGEEGTLCFDDLGVRHGADLLEVALKAVLGDVLGNVLHEQTGHP